jgi:hypothetical protein
MPCGRGAAKRSEIQFIGQKIVLARRTRKRGPKRSDCREKRAAYRNELCSFHIDITTKLRQRARSEPLTPRWAQDGGRHLYIKTYRYCLPLLAELVVSRLLPRPSLRFQRTSFTSTTITTHACTPEAQEHGIALRPLRWRFESR